jgi:adenylate kinase
MIILMGSPGVGKNTIVHGAFNGVRAPGLKDRTMGWEFHRFSDLMVERLRGNHSDITRETIAHLPLAEQLEVQGTVAKFLDTRSHQYPKIFVATHCAIQLPDGTYLRGLPEPLLRLAFIDAMIYVTASDAELKERRFGRQGDRREIERALQQEHENRRMLIEYGIETNGIPLFVVANKQGAVAEAITRIVRIMNDAEQGIISRRKYDWVTGKGCPL